MDDYLKAALEIVKAQASVRNMTDEEITSMVAKLSASIRVADGQVSPEEQPTLGQGVIDPAKAIKESSVICLECGKSFKVITRKHLASHGLTPEAYKEKYGYKKSQPLAAKVLVRERRKKMKEMKLWERRKKAE